MSATGGQSLRQVTMIIKPFKLDAVLKVLENAPISQLVVYECRGYGRQKGHLELYSGPEYVISFLPKIALEFVVSRFELEDLLETLLKTAKTGRIGDGKIFIQTCDSVDGGRI